MYTTHFFCSAILILLLLNLITLVETLVIGDLEPSAEKLKYYCDLSDTLSEDIFQSQNVVFNVELYGEIDFKFLCEIIFPSGREIRAEYINVLYFRSKGAKCDISKVNTGSSVFKNRVYCLRDRFKVNLTGELNYYARVDSTLRLAVGILQNCAGNFDDIFDRSLSLSHILGTPTYINGCKVLTSPAYYPESKLSLLFSHHKVDSFIPSFLPIKSGFITTSLSDILTLIKSSKCLSFDVFLTTFLTLCNMYSILKVFRTSISGPELYDFVFNPGFTIDGERFDDVALWYGLRDQNFDYKYEVFDNLAMLSPEYVPKDISFALSLIASSISVLRSKDIELYDRFIEITQKSYFYIYNKQYSNPGFEELISRKFC